ncbi:MAG: 50S ribosomal protein L15 [Cyclobacteriaceae bacterium]|nr:50S ribosomal protein L15 [Cyclobacteriaceae bacterium]
MKLNSLKPAEGATKSRKRIGRGQGTGRGGTSTRGHKGAKSRSGYKSKLGFEGGQMPLQRRVPKFGFTSPNRIEFKGINLYTIQLLAEANKLEELTPALFIEKGMAGRNDKIKILGTGELTVKLNVSAHAFSAAAIKAIEAAGGTATTV